MEPSKPRYDLDPQAVGPPSALPEASPWRTLLIALLITAAVMTLALLLPTDLWFLSVAAAFLAGGVLERYRQARSPLPPTVVETPREWWWMLSERIGLVWGAGALLLIAAALFVLMVSFGRSHQAQTVPAPSPLQAGPRPQIKLRDESLGKPFTVAGATFRVISSAGSRWAKPLERRIPTGGRVWFALAVEVTNVSRSRFNPALLSYRLRGPGGKLYLPDRGGVVGPSSLGTRQGLTVGTHAEEQLAFLVPADEPALALAFEPVLNGGMQVRVKLPRGSAGSATPAP
jgi:hypothetical protein